MAMALRETFHGATMEEISDLDSIATSLPVSTSPRPIARRSRLRRIHAGQEGATPISNHNEEKNPPRIHMNDIVFVVVNQLCKTISERTNKYQKYLFITVTQMENCL